METVLDFERTMNALPAVNQQQIHNAFLDAMKRFNRKIVILDDDPTGTQTVHSIYVYTNWDEQSLVEAFAAPEAEFFILTNSRSFSEEKVRQEYQKIARNIYAASQATGKDFILISRSDSTLRGHFPLETLVLKQELERIGAKKFDGEILIPFFKEGGRYTIQNTHYVLQDTSLIPAAQTIYASDQTFGYSHSDLRDWIAEKTDNAFLPDSVVSIGIDALRANAFDALTAQLVSVRDFQKVVVNAADYVDLEAFAVSLVSALSRGKEFVFRTAASFPKVIGCIPMRDLLRPEELRARNRGKGGLIIVGSHVPKTTQQLEALRQNQRIVFLEFNQHLILDETAFAQERRRVQSEIEENLQKERIVAVYTKRERLDLGSGDKEAELALSKRIADAVTGFVEALPFQPGFLIAKGGITSSDIGTRGLRVRKALVLGQILDGIPVWLTGEESRFPGMPYVVFPGNVGDRFALLHAVEKMDSTSKDIEII